MPHLCCGLVFLQVNIAGSQVSRFGAAREEDVAFMIFLPASCGRCFFFWVWNVGRTIYSTLLLKQLFLHFLGHFDLKGWGHVSLQDCKDDNVS